MCLLDELKWNLAAQELDPAPEEQEQRHEGATQHQRELAQEGSSSLEGVLSHGSGPRNGFIYMRGKTTIGAGSISVCNMNRGFQQTL